MRDLLTLLFLVTLIVFSCKKKEEAIPQDNKTTTANTATTGAPTGTTGTTTGGSTTGGSTTGGSTTGGSTGGTTTPVNEKAVHGILVIRTLTVATTPDIKHSSEAEAFFSHTPFTEVTPSLGINVGQVLLNGDPLSFNQPTVNTYFRDPLNSVAKGNWSVTGGSAVPAFTFNASFPQPVCHNPGVLPDVISISAGATIALNVSNVTFGNLILNTEGPGITVEMGFGFVGSASTITITPQYLEFLNNVDSATLSLRIENTVDETIKGRHFRFKKESVLKKKVVFKP